MAPSGDHVVEFLPVSLSWLCSLLRSNVAYGPAACSFLALLSRRGIPVPVRGVVVVAHGWVVLFEYPSGPGGICLEQYTYPFASVQFCCMLLSYFLPSLRLQFLLSSPRRFILDSSASLSALVVATKTYKATLLSKFLLNCHPSKFMTTQSVSLWVIRIFSTLVGLFHIVYVTMKIEFYVLQVHSFLTLTSPENNSKVSTFKASTVVPSKEANEFLELTTFYCTWMSFKKRWALI